MRQLIKELEAEVKRTAEQVETWDFKANLAEIQNRPADAKNYRNVLGIAWDSHNMALKALRTAPQ